MCVLDFDGRCEAWTGTWRRARKVHRCDICRSAIPAGSRYHYTFAKYDGELSTGKACALCRADVERFAGEHEGMEPFPGSFVDTLQSCVWDGDPVDETTWKPMLEAIQRRAAA